MIISAGAMSLDAHMKVGLIQTSLHPAAAWASSATMAKAEEDHAIAEIRSFFSAFHEEGSPPDIIVLPELAVPNGFERHLRRMATNIQSVVVAGFDYRLEPGMNKVRNEALMIVPKRWRGEKISAQTVTRCIGKTYPSQAEEQKLNRIPLIFQPDPSVWLFDGGPIGRFGVMVCYDFLDLERIAMYRGRVHHLFILALNKDSNSFNFVAEAVSRMVFCNVVICNCGFYGGSVAVSPYRRAERRTIYRHEGPRLASAQIIELPVMSLDQHQQGSGPKNNGENEFKSLPPGYSHAEELATLMATLRNA